VFGCVYFCGSDVLSHEIDVYSVNCVVYCCNFVFNWCVGGVISCVFW
jgi:hypothetical protein